MTNDAAPQHNIPIKSRKKNKAIPVIGRRDLYVLLSVRYEHHLHIKSKTIAVRDPGGSCVSSVRYEHHLHIKNKSIPVTGL
jgi:hypothetical protein